MLIPRGLHAVRIVTLITEKAFAHYFQRRRVCPIAVSRKALRPTVEGGDGMDEASFDNATGSGSPQYHLPQQVCGL